MREKKGYRYSVSYGSLADNKSMSLKFGAPIALDKTAIRDMILGLCDAKLNDIYESKIGYVYPTSEANYSYITLTLTGRYQIGGEWYPTEKIILKHVKKAFVGNIGAVELYFKDIFNSTFEIMTHKFAYR